jgi:hypothetical protein
MVIYKNTIFLLRNEQWKIYDVLLLNKFLNKIYVYMLYNIYLWC